MTEYINQIFCEDCRDTMKHMISDGFKLDNIITSPFYNTVEGGEYQTSQKSRDGYTGRYDVHLDNLTDEEYIQFTVDLFMSFDKILKENGCVLYNLSYSSRNTELMWIVLYHIITDTPFTIADDIIWKKQSALPNNSNQNKLTRIVEHIFVFCRKSEFKTFKTNKKLKTLNEKGQKFYETYFNFIEAPNNDGANKLNKATFSTDLICKLIDIYVLDGSIVYDPFMGTGTTANACKIKGLSYVGSEISKSQVEYAKNRLSYTTLNDWIN